MEVRCHVNDVVFREKLEPILDSLCTLCGTDGVKFIEVFENMPQPIRMGITSAAANAESFVDTECEDIADYCRDVVAWYRGEYRKANPLIKPFTLRNPNDLKQFEEFLDRMIYLMEISPGHFVDMLTQCPDAYWDKIDDLRETSYKLNRDSAEYLRCLEKCKTISFSYSEYMDLLTNVETDEEFEY